MKVGILGSSGFVGKNLMPYLQSRGIDCMGGGRKLVGHEQVDARVHDDVYWWIRSNRITHVVNLAAECGGIGRNRRTPADLWSATSRISEAVLGASRAAGVSKLVMIGTVCSYALDCPTPFREDYLMHYGPPEPTNRAYGLAKLSSLYGAQAYAIQHGMNINCLIPVNMYGRHDHFDLQDSHVIPAMIAKFSQAAQDKLSKVELWGTGTPTREFLHVADFCGAIELALLYLDEPTFVNIGTGTEISIRDLARMIAKLTNYSGEIVWNSELPDGQPRRCLDVSRARELLKFAAQTTLESGLADTVKWYNEPKEVIAAPQNW